MGWEILKLYNNIQVISIQECQKIILHNEQIKQCKMLPINWNKEHTIIIKKDILRYISMVNIKVNY